MHESVFVEGLYDVNATFALGDKSKSLLKKRCDERSWRNLVAKLERFGWVIFAIFVR